MKQSELIEAPSSGSISDVPSILLVDDDRDLIALLLNQLQASYQLTPVANGEEALDKLQQESYDLVLLDVFMPGSGGLAVCRQMKQDPRLAHIPVIFITAQQDPELVEACFEAGCVDYLTKPVVFTELQRRIQTHLHYSLVERELRHQLARRDLILIALSHDLRGPIGTASTLLRLLADKADLPPALDQLLQSAARGVDQSYLLLENMLTWAQAMGEKFSFQPDWLSLPQLGSECLHTLRPRAEQKGLELLLEVPDGQQIFADRNLLMPILVNLVGNAIKFTSRGKVTLRALQTPGQISIQVEDTGKGLPEALLSQLRQYRPIVSQTGTAGERGTGMGLKICQEFAAYHKGQLEIDSRLGHGTIMSVVLPQPV